MKFHLIEKNGHRREVSPIEYLEAPICKRSKFMEAVRELQAQKELRENAEAALRMAGLDDKKPA